MAIVTSTRTGGVVTKPFAWSFSRLKNFTVCPKRHYEIDLAKNYSEPKGQALDWGSYVHDKLAARCGDKRVPLPDDVAMYEPWALKVISDTPKKDIYVEQSLAITSNFTPTGNFDKDAWLRVKCDFYKLSGNVALAVDFKTGKILEDSVQLALTAACLFYMYPQLEAVKSTYVWLKEDAESSEVFYRGDLPSIWRGLWHRIEAMENAFKMTDYPAKQSGICARFCAVKSCPHNGKSPHS